MFIIQDNIIRLQLWGGSEYFDCGGKMLNITDTPFLSHKPE